jgi:NAD(P)-dependent dehydrogenase (short-subunit alcohol dehydrogenase family)
VLTRSAEINDSWRTLSDRWERARALIELSSPGAMDRGRTLDPEFLATALELAEEVAFADGPDLASLRQRLNATCDDVFAELARACAEDDFAAAARRLHESRYVRKALADLDARGYVPDVLVNNVGINKIGPFAEIDPADFLGIQQVNVFAPFMLCRAAIPTMNSLPE